MAERAEEYLVVAAIDFGTTYSGYAYTFRCDCKNKPFIVNTNVWTASSRKCSYEKAPTSVLFDPKMKFRSFGFNAEETYADLAFDGKANDWYFFSRFKMTLYNKKTINRNFEIIADNGKKLPAMTVFSSCIKYLVNHLLEACNKRVIVSEEKSDSGWATGSEKNMYNADSIGSNEDSGSDRVRGLKKSHFRWVLTVPAIWNDAAKQFMREAAEKAGIPGDQLFIALEPEVASIYCQSSPIKMFVGSENDFGLLQPGDKYLILDCGDGTIDVTVHKVHHDGTLRELHAASGGDWGGTKVDKAFNDLLLNVVGNVVNEKVNRNDKWAYLDLFREFEMKKRKFNPDMAGHITMTVPVAFSDTYKEEQGREVKEAIDEKIAYRGRITWVRDKMRIEVDIAKGFFSESCKTIGKHLEKMFNCPVIKDVSKILMVGGYSESPVLEDFIKKFGEKRSEYHGNQALLF